MASISISDVYEEIKTIPVTKLNEKRCDSEEKESIIEFQTKISNIIEDIKKNEKKIKKAKSYLSNAIEQSKQITVEGRDYSWNDTVGNIKKKKKELENIVNTLQRIELLLSSKFIQGSNPTNNQGTLSSSNTQGSLPSLNQGVTGTLPKKGECYKGKIVHLVTGNGTIYAKDYSWYDSKSDSWIEVE